MSIPNFRPIAWEPLDVISGEMLNQMNSNMSLLNDYTPRAKWMHADASHTKGLKILSGKKLIARQPKKSEVNVRVGFGAWFSPGCQPNVTTGINSRQIQNIYCTFSGLDWLTPTNEGMRLHVQIAKEADEKKNIARNIWIHWTAVGY